MSGFSSIVKETPTPGVRRCDFFENRALFVHTRWTADATAEVADSRAFSELCREKTQDDGCRQETLDATNASAKVAIEKDAAQVDSIGADIVCPAEVLHCRTRRRQRLPTTTL